MLLNLALRVFLLVIAAVSAIPIDNGVKGYPTVVCGSGDIQVEIETQKFFSGRLYIKGEAHKKQCSKSFANEGRKGGGYPPAPSPGFRYTSGPVVGVDMKLGECNMQRQRTLYPRGVEYTFTLVVSFHPLFLTKVDRAYRIRCFYMEAEKTVNAQVDVSMLTTRQVNEQFPMPKCHYHLKRGGPDGPYVRYAKVGDEVVHVWACDKSSAYVYGMLVKNCYVDDGQGNKVQLVDDKGCPVDEHLIPSLSYDDHLLSAHVHTHVFKYADKPHLLFTCTLQICYKRDGGCYGLTPPKCGSRHHASGPTSAVTHTYPDAGTYAPADLTYPNKHGHVDLEYDSASSYSSESAEILSPPHYGVPVPAAPAPSNYEHVPYSPSGSHNSAHGLHPAVPYKDDPVLDDEEEIENNATDRKVRSVTGVPPVALELMETDLSAQPLVVLPVDEQNTDDSVVPLFENRRVNGVCLTTQGFGLALSLFIVSVCTSTTTVVLLMRKYKKEYSNVKA